MPGCAILSKNCLFPIFLFIKNLYVWRNYNLSRKNNRIMANKNFCVIMAGGIGSRFWPFSRTSKPKQFLDILGVGRSLLQQTYDRFIQIMPAENILVVTNKIYFDIVTEQLPALPHENILLEPFRRNTAPCIAYANAKIQAKTNNANIVVAPSDHLILKENVFLDVVKKGLSYVENEKALLTLGIKPSRPETGYGYIQVQPDNEFEEKNPGINRVKLFTEKPDFEMAKVFVENGGFFWNSGLFFWSLKTINEAFEQSLPDISSLFKEGTGKYNTKNEDAFVTDIYQRCKSISIDYGVMEKAQNVSVICSDFGWSDLGTWGSLYENSDKDQWQNSVNGKNVFLYNTSNSLINVPANKCVALQGLDGYIVVDTADTLLVCKMHDEQEIKNIVTEVKERLGDDFM